MTTCPISLVTPFHRFRLIVPLFVVRYHIHSTFVAICSIDCSIRRCLFITFTFDPIHSFTLLLLLFIHSFVPHSATRCCSFPLHLVTICCYRGNLLWPMLLLVFPRCCCCWWCNCWYVYRFLGVTSVGHSLLLFIQCCCWCCWSLLMFIDQCYSHCWWWWWWLFVVVLMTLLAWYSAMAKYY